MALSAAVEVSQLLFVQGRDASFSDVVANTLGGMLGALLAVQFMRSWSLTSRFWMRAALGSAVLAAALLFFGAWATNIHIPRETYFVQWEPQRPGYAPFRGELSRLTVNGLTLSPGEVLPAAKLPQEFFDGRIIFEAALIPASNTAGLSLIARLALTSDEFFTLAQQEQRLVGAYRSNAQRVRLRSLLFAMENAFDPVHESVTQVRVLTRAGAVELSVKTGIERRVIQRVNTSRLWATLMPFDMAIGSRGVFMDLVWLALVIIPAAYSGTRSTGGWRAITPIASVLAALVALALLEESLRWWPYWTVVVIAAVLSASLGSRARARSENAPANGARSFK